MKYDVFISYSRKDTNIANRICQALDKANINYFNYLVTNKEVFPSASIFNFTIRVEVPPKMLLNIIFIINE